MFLEYIMVCYGSEVRLLPVAVVTHVRNFTVMLNVLSKLLSAEKHARRCNISFELNSAVSFFSLSQWDNQWRAGEEEESVHVLFTLTEWHQALLETPVLVPGGKCCGVLMDFATRAHLWAVWKCNYAGNGSATAKWLHQQERKWSYTRSRQCAASLIVCF